MNKNESRVATRLCRFISFVALWSALILSLNLRPAEAGSATWNFLPFNGDWNTAMNWTPPTVPNGPGDTATFGVSSHTSVSLSADTEVDSIVFNPGTTSYTIAAQGTPGLTLSGAGIINNSSVTQNFFVIASIGSNYGSIHFINNASAGNGTLYDVKGNDPMNSSGFMTFSDSSNAGSAMFLLEAGVSQFGGYVGFYDNSTPANASFTLTHAPFPFGPPPRLDVVSTSSVGNLSGAYLLNGGFTSVHFLPAGVNSISGNWIVIGGFVDFEPGTGGIVNGAFTVKGVSTPGEYGGQFFIKPGGPLSGTGAFTVEGGAVAGTNGGVMSCSTVDTGNRSYIAKGGNGASAGGGTLSFLSTPGVNGQLIASGGTNQGGGGRIIVQSNLAGATPSMKALGNGAIDVSGWSSGANAAKSIQGDGIISLGGYNLTVGSSNTSTTFSGLLQDGGTYGGSGASIVKVGSGTLNLAGASTYTGGTYVTAGRLLVSNVFGSATGHWPGHSEHQRSRRERQDQRPGDGGQ